MKKKKGCGCQESKYRKMMDIPECFNNKTDGISIFEAYKFQASKPFKVTFNEDIEVSFKTLSEQKKPKKLTNRDKAQKEEMVGKLKGKMGEFKKKYGKRAKGVMYAVATKHAKKTP